MSRKSWLPLYCLFSFCIVLLSLEIFSRLYKPIFPGVSRISLEDNSEIPSFNTPESKYIQKSSEFSVVTTINSLGNRVVPSSNNISGRYLVFLGDSFTFGQAASDYESVPNIVCEKYRSFNCINLGIPGSSAIEQFAKMERFLEGKYNLKGYLFHLILASTGQNHAGNDLSAYPKSKILSKPKDLNQESPHLQSFIRSQIRELSKHSNLFRIIRLYAGDRVRLLAFSNATGEISQFQINQFSEDISKISAGAQKAGLVYVPVLVSSSSSIATGDNIKTHVRLEQEIGKKILLPESKWDLRRDFFPLDGHATFEGNKKFAQVIIDRLESSDLEK